MIVSRRSFKDVVKLLSVSGQYGLDTETTGLALSDRIFSIIIADAHQAYYFNFQAYKDIDKDCVLPREWIKKLSPITCNPASLFFIHNAKFDLGMLEKDELFVEAEVHCTEVMERVLNNNYIGHKPYSLATCAKRRGLQKDEAVEAYIKANKLITKVNIPGKDKLSERWHFDRVPWETISMYGENDAKLHRAIGMDQLGKLAQVDAQAPTQAPKIMTLVANEYKLTKVCHRIEREGIKINRPYVEKALAYNMEEADRGKTRFLEQTGIEYQDSAGVFKKAFAAMGIELPLTKTGQPATNKQVLDALDNPLANLIRKIRGIEKLCSTYYSSFLHFADSNGLVHANIRQGGTETGRFSYSDPNLQNLPKEDDPDDEHKTFHVRKSFVPLDGDWCFVPIDFKQQEFRMMLDYAGETDMIKAIMDGMDVHEATAQELVVSRKYAKTLNFGLLYGMGPGKLAVSLGVSFEQACELRNRYFQKLPGVKALIDSIMNTGRKRGFIWNWFGFRNHISSPEYAYVLPNHLIQGGCAQVIRIAMVQLDEYRRKHRLRSSILAQVHDELLFQVHRTELQHVPEFQRIMESVYKPRNGLFLHCSIEHSWKSWGKWDMRKGLPDGQEARNAV